MELSGSTALVTGAASGIGRALTQGLLERGAAVIMADVEAGPLEEEAATLAAEGDVTPVVMDVASIDDWQRAARVVGDRDVDLLVNNAGVGTVGPPTWELTRKDWRWVTEVNLWGAINGLDTFLGAMVERNRGHVVNVSSAAGLLTPRGMAPYVVTKHALVALSEALHHELADAGSAVGVTVVCPGLVATRMAANERNRPGEYRNDAEIDDARAEKYGPAAREMTAATASGRPPAEMAAAILDAMQSRTFYLILDDWITGAFAERARRIVDGEAPNDPS